ncbi:MAG: PAS domain S-box protein [Verrucomicrobia bacterium]|nr:PAS domain S-box protein [Verrucomicrobiota bacterium]
MPTPSTAPPAATNPDEYNRLHQLDRILSSSPVMVFVWRMTDTFPIDFASGNVTRMGYTADDFTSGRVSWIAIIHPDDVDRLQRELGVYLKEGVAGFSQIYRLRNSQGNYRWYRDYNRLIRDANGTVTHVEGLVLDATANHDAAERLSQFQDSFQVAFAGATDAMLWADPESGIIVNCNPASEVLFERDRDNLIGQHCAFMFPQDDSTAVLEKLRQHVEAETVTEHAMKIVTATGAAKYVDVTSNIITLHDHPILHCVLHDVTHLVQANEAIDRSQRRLEAAEAATQTGSYVWDLVAGTMELSKQARRLLGLESEALINDIEQLIDSIIHPEDVDFVRAEMIRARQDLTPRPLDFRIQRPDGSTPLIHSEGRTLYHDSGQPTAIAGTLRDVTLERASERALQISQERSRAILSALPDLVLVLDEDGTYIDLLTAADDLLYLDREQLIGKRLHDVFKTEYADLFATAIRETIRTGVTQIVDYELDVPKGQVFFEGRTASLDMLENGKRAVVFVARDVTDRRRLEQEVLNVSNHERQRIGEALHDSLGQLLTGIGYLARATEQGLRKDDNPLAEQAARIGELVTVAMQQSRDLAYGLSPVDMKEAGLAPTIKRLLESTQDVTGIDCQFTFPNPCDIHQSDVALHLYHLTQEAVTNAVRHAQASAISVQLDLTPDGGKLVIQDNGIGIGVQHRDTTKGIGLRIMQRRAEIIGGALVIEHPVAGGTRVICSFENPAAESRPPK